MTFSKQRRGKSGLVLGQN